MNREYALSKAYDARVAGLSPWKAAAFGAGVLEHVLPLLQRRGFSAVLRPAVDELWSSAGGGEPSPSRVGGLQRELLARIPDVAREASLEGELLRDGGIMVLEALDYL